LPLNPTVSIILPVWNGERFLAQAIDSVLRQTFESFELLVINRSPSIRGTI
jgi:glycosyltransferase involved in cell wall biosynthesis